MLDKFSTALSDIVSVGVIEIQVIEILYLKYI